MAKPLVDSQFEERTETEGSIGNRSEAQEPQRFFERWFRLLERMARAHGRNCTVLLSLRGVYIIASPMKDRPGISAGMGPELETIFMTS